MINEIMGWTLLHLSKPESEKERLKSDRRLNHLRRQHKQSLIREVCFNNKWDNTNWV